MKVQLTATADKNDALSLKDLDRFIDYAGRIDCYNGIEPKVETRTNGKIRKISVETYRS